MTAATEFKNNYRGELEDRIREALLKRGTRDVDITIDDLIGETGYSHPQVYQALYRLSNNGQIDLVKEDEDAGRSKLVGVKLLRMEPISDVYARTNGRETAAKVTKTAIAVDNSFPNTLEYIKHRLAIEKAREELYKAGIENSVSISFTPNPLGEEAIALFQMVQNLSEEKIMLTNDLVAAKQNVETYKSRLATQVFNDSGT